MPLAVRVPPQSVDLDEHSAAPDRLEVFPLLRAAVPAPGPAAFDEGLDLVVRRAAPKRRPEVDPALRVQAEEPRPVRGETAPVTRPAKRRRRRGDDAERRPVRETEPLCGRGCPFPNRSDRAVAGLQVLEDLGPGNDLLS